MLYVTQHLMRSEQLLALRSEIPLDDERCSLELEHFQNVCLRPILKFQNDALILYFKSQINVFKIPKLKNDLESFIRLQLQKEITLRNALIGMVLGLMSEEELAFYLLHKNELSRRIVSMLIQRLSTGVML